MAAAVTAVTTLFGAPIAIPIVGVAALVGLRVIHHRRRSRLGRELPVLLVDAAGEDLLLQVHRAPALETKAVAGAYRTFQRSREPIAGEEPTRPTPARIAARGQWFVALSSTGLCCLVGWDAAYPQVVLDNPVGTSVVFTIDGAREVAVSTSKVIRLPYGNHRFEVDGKPLIESRMALGSGPVLVSSASSQCYRVVSSVKNRTSSGTFTTTKLERTVKGPLVSIQDPHGVWKTPCPSPLSPPP